MWTAQTSGEQPRWCWPRCWPYWLRWRRSLPRYRQGRRQPFRVLFARQSGVKHGSRRRSEAKGDAAGRHTLTVAALLVLAAASVSGQGQPSKKFLGGPLVIEDQGSFFVGGVKKITDHAVVPPPGAPASQAAVPQEI